MALEKKRSAPGGANGPSKKGKFEKKGSKLSGSSARGNDKPNLGKPGSYSKATAGKAPRSTAPRGGRASRGEKEEEVKRRKLPLTATPTQDAAESDDEDVDMEEGDDEPEAMQVDEQSEQEGVVATGSGADQKRLSKAEKAALHAAQPHRTTLLPSHPLLRDTLLPLWEEARQADLSKDERKTAVSKLWQAMKGRVAEISRGHKGGRILQTVIKHGGKEERNGVATELKGQYKQMMTSKYSKFLIGKIVRYSSVCSVSRAFRLRQLNSSPSGSPSIRPVIISEIQQDIPQLLFHTHACPIVSDFYELYASPKEKRLMVRGFYPKEVIVFESVATGEEAGVPSLQSVLDGMSEGKGRERVLDELAEKIVHVFNSTQKEALAQAIFHRLVWEYLSCVYKYLDDEQADRKMHELLEASLESLADIVHTRDGASVVREFLARGIAKDRKNILRVIKPHLQKLCEDPEAQMVLFTAFDTVDDTKMMGKAIIPDISAQMPELAMHKVGRRVLLYLLVPRSSKYFIPSTVAQLVATDASASKTSKKQTSVRREELRAAADDAFLSLAQNKGEEMLRDAGASLLLTEIMLHAKGDKAAAIGTLVEPLKQPYPFPAIVESNPDPSTAHVLDLAWTGRCYKTILAGGHYDQKSSSVAVADAGLGSKMARAVWDALSIGHDNVRHVALGNAPFVLVELVEASRQDPALHSEIRQALQQPGTQDEVAKSVRKGASVLAEKIASL